jgi:tetratricopeptide (TPR) repeat protein
MSKILLNYQEKQRILYIDHRPERDLIAYGDAFLEAGKISDAIEFYQKANNITGLEKIKGMAEDSGDVMLFQQVLKPLKQHVSDEEWNAMGRRAFELEKYSFALHAFEKSNNSTMAEQIKKIMMSKENKQSA